MFSWLLELAFVNASIVFKLTKAIKFSIFKIPNILKSFACQLAESIRFTVPHLALVISTVGKLVAPLACAFSIPPFSSINVTAAKHFFTLAVLPPLTEMTSIDVITTESQLSEAVLQVLMPLPLIAVSVFKQLCTVAFFHSVLHFSLIVESLIFIVHLNETRRCLGLFFQRFYRHILIRVDAALIRHY